MRYASAAHSSSCAEPLLQEVPVAAPFEKGTAAVTGVRVSAGVSVDTLDRRLATVEGVGCASA